MTALAASQGAGDIGDVASMTDGYSAAFLGAAGIAVAGAVLSAVLLRGPSSAGSAPADVATEAREPIAA
jgi:hypothetical protein